MAQDRVNPERQALVDFRARVDEYYALHKKLEATLPKLSKEATPQEIDRDQRALAALIAAERAKAPKRGDSSRPTSRQSCGTSSHGCSSAPIGAKLRASRSWTRTRGSIRLTVNGRYPDHVPLANMPAEVLESPAAAA